MQDDNYYLKTTVLESKVRTYIGYILNFWAPGRHGRYEKGSAALFDTL